jgi:hypothetical protein
LRSDTTSDLALTPVVWHGETPSLMPANPVELRRRTVGTDGTTIDTKPFTTAEDEEGEREHSE